MDQEVEHLSEQRITLLQENRNMADRIGRLEGALEGIARLTAPGNRTFDEVIRDMGLACDRARWALTE
jgi:hypothetical protein